MNPAAEGLLGVSLTRATRNTLTDLVPGAAALNQICDRARQEQKSFGYAIKILSSQRDDCELELAVRVSPFTVNLEPAAAQTNSVSGDDTLLLELFDITQRHQLDRERALLAQHGASRRMLRQLAHEIRNPLGGLRGAAQLLEHELNDPDLREFTQVIIGEADRLAKLMTNMLGPGSQPNMRPANLHEQLERIATIVESEWPMLTIVRDYDPSLPDFYFDPDQLTQALLNLVRNASQATGSAGQVILRTRVLTNQVLNKSGYKLVALVEVEDNGPGVAADIADTLFYPLVTGRQDGSGLGLPLAQDLVNRHSGLIEFVSEPGRTVFSVQLPVKLKPSAT
jgi:two-component system nitrogen regulation sensor histidine kinase GlnL